MHIRNPGCVSHSSVLTREYSTPAVVSVDGAMRLADGTLVTADGYNGIVHRLRRKHSRQAKSALTPLRTAA